MKRAYVALGCTQQSRVTPTRLVPRKTLPTLRADLLLASGAIVGPYKPTRPITRWRLLGRQIVQEIAALCRITLKD